MDSWNRADGLAYGENYWPDAELVSPVGKIFDGRPGIAQLHVDLWAGIFKGSRMVASVVESAKARRQPYVWEMVARWETNRVYVGPRRRSGGLRDECGWLEWGATHIYARARCTSMMVTGRQKDSLPIASRADCPIQACCYVFNCIEPVVCQSP